ncbi:integrator complex subunit 10-like [Lethenteron reissneri]|uniref:integrator complex subunit 10-like n=1 Tax=Lethenteron reissneri TaxID=7753 RepID=UPI002AB7BC0F|nr:integrator complex subunit 10-like [Lethenteron reissneri]XP_061432331.1 integrator complex subunit 10-like [Lethenteron reissneri]
MAAAPELDFVVRKAHGLAGRDPWAAKAWLLTARTIYPGDFAIQFEMYLLEKNAQRATDAARLLCEMFVQFPEKPPLWREINCITSALRAENPDAQTQFLRCVFECLPAPVQCDVLYKSAEQQYGALQQAEAVMLLLRRFPDAVVQHGVKLAETLLDSEKQEGQNSPTGCFRKLFVCELLPVILGNPDVCLPRPLLYKYLLKAAEFYITTTTRTNLGDSPHPVVPDCGVVETWSRLTQLLHTIGSRCDWQTDRPNRPCGEVLQRVREASRYVTGGEDEAQRNLRQQVVMTAAILFFRHAHGYLSSVTPTLFSGVSGVGGLVLLEELSQLFVSGEADRAKHGGGSGSSKRRKLEEGGQSAEEEYYRSRHVAVPSGLLPGAAGPASAADVLESFRIAREAWDVLHAHPALEKEFLWVRMQWRTETWPWLLAFLSDMLIYQGQYRHAIATLQQQQAGGQAGVKGQVWADAKRVLLQMAACHLALGEHLAACERVLEVAPIVAPNATDVPRLADEPPRVKPKFAKGSDLQLVPCTDRAIISHGVQIVLSCFKPHAFSEVSRDDLALGHVIVMLQHDWPKGEALFLRAVERICLQGGLQYENFFNYVTNVDMLEEFAFLRTPEGGRVQLELLPNQAVLTKQQTVTRGVTKGVKEDFRLAMERQVSRCAEPLFTVLHRFLLSERNLLLQGLG